MFVRLPAAQLMAKSVEVVFCVTVISVPLVSVRQAFPPLHGLKTNFHVEVSAFKISTLFWEISTVSSHVAPLETLPETMLFAPVCVDGMRCISLSSQASSAYLSKCR